MPKSTKVKGADTGLGAAFEVNVIVYVDGDSAISPGKAMLLEAIHETGSISAAGRRIDLGYRSAWQWVLEMNRCFKSALVIATKGGLNGGGAHLSPTGLEVLRRYRQMDQATKQVAQAYLGRISELVSGEKQNHSN